MFPGLCDLFALPSRCGPRALVQEVVMMECESHDQISEV